jgi:hypothetical protein
MLVAVEDEPVPFRFLPAEVSGIAKMMPAFSGSSEGALRALSLSLCRRGARLAAFFACARLAHVLALGCHSLTPTLPCVPVGVTHAQNHPPHTQLAQKFFARCTAG